MGLKQAVQRLISKMRKVRNEDLESDEFLFPLSPALLDDESLSQYTKEFEFVFSHNNIKNVALSGAYGAGKSTVIESWENKDAICSYLHVSLAHFTGAEKTSEQDVEQRVLNQIIHSIDHRKMPKTRFRKTFDRKASVDALLAVGIAACILIAVSLPYLTRQQTLDDRAFVALACVLFSFLTIVLYRFIRSQFVSKFVRRLKFMNAELEMPAIPDDSVFDRCMDDILYALNASNCDVIVFEDLDRFDSITVFEKLREINVLANTSRRGSRPPLRFFYLVRDGLFKDAGSRTKFFDYIIPVIPYVSPSNALAVINTGLERIEMRVNQTFLYQLSLFIEDPRILHDIVNETDHFRRCLFDSAVLSEDDACHLISMIAYKTLFPSDYENLQRNRGCVHALLRKRKRLIESTKSALKAEVKSASEEIAKIQQQNIYNEEELSILYGASKLYQLFNFSRDYYGNYTGLLKDCDTPATFIEAINQSSQLDSKFNEIVNDLLENNEEYLERLQEIRNESTRKTKVLQNRIDSIERECLECDRMSISQLIAKHSNSGTDFFNLTQGDFERSKDYDELCIREIIEDAGFPLIRFLISSGMIDDSYERFISVSHPGDLSNGDRDFLKLLLQGNPIDRSYSVDDAASVLMKLDASALARENARNFSLVAFILHSKNDTLIDFLFRGIEYDDDLLFLIDFVNSDWFVESVVEEMEDRLQHPISRIVNNNNFDFIDRRRFCHRVLAAWASLDDFSLKTIGSFASNDPGFLHVDKADPAKLRDALSAIEYYPTCIELRESNVELLKKVRDDSLYEPNAVIVESLLSIDKEMTDEEDEFPSSLLPDMVRSCPHASVRTHVEQHMDVFIGSFLKEWSKPIRGSEPTTVWVLNAEVIDEQLSEQYILRLQSVEITSIAEIDSLIKRRILLDHGFVACSALNVLRYYRDCDMSVDDSLAMFLEERGIPLDLTHETIVKEFGANAANFLLHATKSNLSAKGLQILAAQIGVSVPRFDLSSLPDDKVISLIECNSIEMNAFNLSFLRNEYADCVPLFAASNIDSYIALTQEEKGDSEEEDIECAFSPSEATEILSLPNVPAEEKIKILDGFEEPVRINKDYPDKLIIAILKEHFDEADIVQIPDLYTSKADNDLRDTLTWRAAIMWASIIEKGIVLPVQMLKDTLERLAGNRQAALSLIAAQCGNSSNSTKSELSRRDVRDFFTMAKCEDYVTILDGHQTKIRRTEYDAAMVKTLVSLGMCGKIHEIGGGVFLLVYPRGYSRTKS